jgi:hypothetical protein
MHSFRVFLSTPGSLDLAVLRTFGDTVFHNPLYADVVAAFRQRLGFIRKTNTLIDSKDEIGVLIEILFDSEENCKLYASDPSTVSLWEYFGMYANENGITISTETTEKFLNI